MAAVGVVNRCPRCPRCGELASSLLDINGFTFCEPCYPHAVCRWCNGVGSLEYAPFNGAACANCECKGWRVVKAWDAA